MKNATGGVCLVSLSREQKTDPSIRKILEYLQNEILPEDEKRARKIAIQALDAVYHQLVLVTPRPWRLASVSTTNFFSKLGYASNGASASLSLRVSNASWQALHHSNGVSFPEHAGAVQFSQTSAQIFYSKRLVLTNLTSRGTGNCWTANTCLLLVLRLSGVIV